MTVGELIKELERLPKDLPVITDLKEIQEVKFNDGTYFLDDSPGQYSYYEAVVLR